MSGSGVEHVFIETTNWGATHWDVMEAIVRDPDGCNRLRERLCRRTSIGVSR